MYHLVAVLDARKMKIRDAKQESLIHRNTRCGGIFLNDYCCSPGCFKNCHVVRFRVLHFLLHIIILVISRVPVILIN
jgi:hypothetical protein